MTDNDRERSRERDRIKRERPSRFSDEGRDRSLDRGKDRGGSKSSVCRVYVSNIPYEYRWQDLKDLFRNQVGDVSFVELFVDETDKPRGCGIVEFSDPESVKKCLEVMHRFELKGRKLVIKEDFGNQRDKYGNRVGSAANKSARDRDDGRDRFRDDRRGGGYEMSNQLGRSNQDMSDGKWGNTYGLSAQFLDSLGIHVPLINRVFIANLDYKVDKKKLKEVFRMAGRIQRIDLSTDKDGKSRGFAVLEYDHPVEAVQAISMFHNHVLYDRAMTVRMDREGDRPMLKLPDGLKGIGMGLGSNGEPLRDVARNLPSLSQTSTNQSVNAGTGILGPMPTVSALSNLNSVGSSAFNSLSTNAAILQAANLAGVSGLSSNLLASSLGGGDLGLAAASLVNNPLVQNSSLASLTGSRNLGSGGLGSSNFSRSELSSGQTGSGYQTQGMSQNQNYLSSGNRNYENKTSSFSFGSGDRDNNTRNTSGNVYSTVNNGSQMIRSSGGGNTGIAGKSGGYSNKVLINNLPPSASYKMLSEKCNEFGNVQRIEDKGNSGILITFSTEWEAEQAIKNMDRARIDGRTIDVRFFY
ncbi:hypothetical protein RN001_006373 [Aquatica leii]|uniref:RRM domain-containing protein n=1 Tax=Aquatica leii TaxID=1421715 RepID=A0AAN7Q1N8_9COLE|nr:hypothetical protein RN001_006373 [Aquatica leii]